QRESRRQRYAGGTPCTRALRCHVARIRFPHLDRKEPARLMNLTAFLAMVRKDLLLFLSDRRAVIVAFAVPIFIGSFIGSITGGSGRNDRPRVDVAISDEDSSAMSKAIVAAALADPNLKVTTVTAAEAKDRVRKGASAVAVVIPPGFGDGSVQALARRSETRPQLSVFFDPSRAIEVQLVQGVM